MRRKTAPGAQTGPRGSRASERDENGARKADPWPRRLTECCSVQTCDKWQFGRAEPVKYSLQRSPRAYAGPGPHPDQPAAARDNGTKIRHFPWPDQRHREIARFADLNLNPRLPASAGPRNGCFLVHVT